MKDKIISFAFIVVVVVFGAIAITLFVFLAIYFRSEKPQIKKDSNATSSPVAVVVAETESINLPTVIYVPGPIGSVSSFEMVLLPGGTYSLGDKGSIVTVQTESIYVDRYEVTNAQFAAFLNSQRKPSLGWQIWINYEIGGSGIVEDVQPSGEVFWRPQFSGGQDYGRYPTVHITQFGAQAFCQWRDARLPTNAEWEIAAKSSEDGTYPWGSGSDNPSSFSNLNSQSTLPVGDKPLDKSAIGAMDMGGNVSEWTSTALPENPTYFILKGGSYLSSLSNAEISQIQWRLPDRTSADIGFRCVTSADAAKFVP